MILGISTLGFRKLTSAQLAQERPAPGLGDVGRQKCVTRAAGVKED